MDSARLEAFSDGVFAVAITLLALDLVVAGPGHGTLAHQLADKWPAFAAYFISFLTIGIIWVNHHTIFKNLADIDRTLLFLNLLLLFFVVSIPFATSTMATYLTLGGTDSHIAAAMFMGAYEGMSIAFALIFWWSIRHEHLKVPLPPADARRAMVRFGMGHIFYIAGIGIAFVSATATLVISAVVAAYYVVEQTPRRDAAADAG
ncbi:MAG TPA: TMEM175 family protein [Acidimicrobiales bacterium]|jgi:uncharacterized membrane protein|nr:TMEM175 family protein [Acidimicrobiales bacterium]